MHKIIIVEDDPSISNSIKKHLEKWGYQADCACDFHEIFSYFLKTEPHLVILDITLPFFDGYHWCRQIREVSQVPIIFLSSAGENMNIIMAMNMGADDFISKPFDLDVLAVKIQALLRRTYSFSKDYSILTFHDVLLNLLDSTLSFRDQKISLTKNELKILQILFEHPGMIVSRNDLMDALWQSDQFIDDNTLSVNVNRLRKKLLDIGLSDFIVTKKGNGYMVI